MLFRRSFCVWSEDPARPESANRGHIRGEGRQRQAGRPAGSSIGCDATFGLLGEATWWSTVACPEAGVVGRAAQLGGLPSWEGRQGRQAGQAGKAGRQAGQAGQAGRQGRQIGAVVCKCLT